MKPTSDLDPPDSMTSASLPPVSLTHFDIAGQAHMVDVGHKSDTHRVAIAQGRIAMQPATLKLIAEGNSKKGDVLGIARIAAIQAAKKTSDLIPLCHPLALTRIAVDFALDELASCVSCKVTTETVGPTGVEMEALTAVQVALLTIYDMCKAVDRGMVMNGVQLIEKHGGKSGDWHAHSAAYSAAHSAAHSAPHSAEIRPTAPAVLSR